MLQHKFALYISYNSDYKKNDQFDYLNSLFKESYEVIGSSFKVCFFYNQTTFVSKAIEEEELLLFGQVYNQAGSLEFLRSDNEGRLKSVDGIYSGISIHKKRSEIRLISDRLCGRKLFYKKYSDAYIVSNFLDSFKLDSYEVDYGGVGWYLSNGNVYNGKTIINGVESVKYGTVVKINKEDVYEQRYWDLDFLPDHTKTKKSLMYDLSDLITSEIETRATSEYYNFISLSGGYDASAIYGTFNERIKQDFTALTYYYNTIGDYSDAKVATNIANLYSQKIECYNYKGDIGELFELNNKLGMGTSFFCEENLGLLAFCKRIENSKNTFFTGDEFFGWVDEPIRNNSQLFSSININKPNTLKSFKKYFHNEEFKRIYNDLTDQVIMVEKSIPDFSSNFDKKMYLYYSQRLTNTIMPWREFHTSYFISPQIPFLSNSIIDFVVRLPEMYRINKSLFKDTVEWMFPKLYSIDRAATGNSIPNWTELLKENKTSLLNKLEEENKIEKILNSEQTEKIFAEKENRELKRLLYKMSKKLLRINYLNNIIGEQLPRFQYLSQSDFLKRVILLKMFFTKKK